MRRSICTACEEDLPILPHNCTQCAQFFSSKLFNDSRCGHCQTTPPPFDKTYAAYPYTFPIIEMIIKLKFHHQLNYAQALGECMADMAIKKWYANTPLPNLILPIPLHPSRLRERGFNQAIEIAKPIAKRLHLPIDRCGVKRIKPTLAQSGLSAADREINLTHAFQATRLYTGLHVAIIDDVITTGHTVTACAKILKSQGASCIDIWCSARAGVALAAKTR
jgi:ComF family protein